MKILSLDGGGYLGMATASFIRETERHFKVAYADNFELFCGTSTGAIIALALASGKSGEEICSLYNELGKKVFYNPFWIAGSQALRSVRSLVIAKYSNKQLRTALISAFGSLKLGDIKARGKSVIIPAFSLTTGRPRVFKTDHSEELTRDDEYSLCDVAMASSAAPIYFPAVRLCSPQGVEEMYCDGGLFANHPGLLGYAEAVSHLRIAPENVRILSLSTPREDLSEWASQENLLRRLILSRGLVFWRTKVVSAILDSTSLATHEALKRITAGDESRYLRITLSKPRGVDLDNASNKATRALQQVGAEVAMKSETRHQLAPFLTEGRVTE